MALAFPLAKTEFFEAIPIRSAVFDLPDTRRFSRTQSGEIISADPGVRLWQGTIECETMPNDMADYVLSRLRLLTDAGASFMMRNPKKVGPASDPAAAIIGATPLTLESVNGNARDVRIGGLPVGYVLTRGDMVGWSYGSNPLRFALHSLVSDQVANGLGEATVEVTPKVNPGWVVDAAVQIVSPQMKAIVLPGSVSPGAKSRRWTEGLSFGFMQTLR